MRNGLRRDEKPWSRLDKALRATDQILQTGGFRVVVLDLASIVPEQALRIPSATWYRFSRAAQEGDAILLLLTQEPCARSSAKCVLDCQLRMTQHHSGNILSGFVHASEIIRQRVGRHPMAHCREQLRRMKVSSANDLRELRHGVNARIAGCVIARQRPGTAHGFIFLSIEDETGISNAIIDPELYERNRSLVTYARFLLIEGTLQNVNTVIHIRASHIKELTVTAAPTQSHDFH